jgi:hypothetical protein
MPPNNITVFAQQRVTLSAVALRAVVPLTPLSQILIAATACDRVISIATEAVSNPKPVVDIIASVTIQGHRREATIRRVIPPSPPDGASPPSPPSNGHLPPRPSRLVCFATQQGVSVHL